VTTFCPAPPGRTRDGLKIEAAPTWACMAGSSGHDGVMRYCKDFQRGLCCARLQQRRLQHGSENRWS